ncbi:MAG: hypothetical protein RJB60_1881 [Pseudomonadota bacterium]
MTGLLHAAYRHPRPQGHEGRCIGQTDLPVDPRKLRRLARRIRREAQREGWPSVVCTSPLKRCHGVGRLLRRWGWRHEVSAALLEMNFGAWEGRPWSRIARTEVDAWVEHFADHAPGGGESLRQVLVRAVAWQAPVPGAVVVAHAGWMLARRWAHRHGAGVVPASACEWPAPPAYGECWRLP